MARRLGAQELIEEARYALQDLRLPTEQQNERSAICLLGLLGLRPGQDWVNATDPLLGIRGLLDVARQDFGRQYAENTRETFRRQTMHQFVQAGIARYNPDDPGRPTNSPRACYQVSPEALDAFRTFGTEDWAEARERFLKQNAALADVYARERVMEQVAVQVRPGEQVRLSPGPHSELIRAIVEEFAPRYAPGAQLVYVGDTGEKWAYLDKGALDEARLSVEDHGKMPDVVLLDPERAWIFLIEAVTSHGPVNPKRYGELCAMLRDSEKAPIFVTAFPDRTTLSRYLAEIAWETEVWVADSPSHLIHFDGVRFLGPFVDQMEGIEQES